MQRHRGVVDPSRDRRLEHAMLMKVVLFLTVAAVVSLAWRAPASARPRPAAARTANALPSADEEAPTDGVLERVEGRRARVQGSSVSRWQVGLPVVVREPGAVAEALQLAAGVVIARAGDRAIVLLEEGAPALPTGARVEPRWQAEARAFADAATVAALQVGGATAAADKGAGGAAGGGEAAGAAGAKPRPQVWHQAPDAAPYAGTLWLEVVATPEHAALVVRWRLGRLGPYHDQPMAAGPDGRWTAQLAIQEPDEDIDTVEYYIGATVSLPGEATRAHVIVGHAAQPLRVAIRSAPGLGRRVAVDHQPPTRWTHQKALPVVARVDRRYSAPTLLYRARGGGTFEAVAMQRVGGDVYRAEIPAARVVVPGLAYAIQVQDAKGMSRDGFASRAEPFTVHVTRGTVLSPEDARNRVALGLTMVGYDLADDGYARADIGLERMFFGFLVGRLQAEATLGRAPVADADGALVSAPLRLYGGSAGLELRVGDYVGLTGDLLMAIHREGAGIGYAAGARIGDEAGSHLTVDWRAVHDLVSGTSLLEQLRVALSVPVGRSLRLDGVVVHEDVLTDASRGLRFLLEAHIPLGARVFMVASGGFAGRDADRAGATGGLRLGTVF